MTQNSSDNKLKKQPCLHLNCLWHAVHEFKREQYFGADENFKLFSFTQGEVEVVSH